MNNVFAFANAEEFKELFGMRKTQEGNLVRKNKVLLRFLQDKKMHVYLRDKCYFGKEVFKYTDLQDLTALCEKYGVKNSFATGNFHIMGRCLYSDKYETDLLKGLCEDEDIRCIRYVNRENGRTFKMRAGKMYRHLLSQTEFGRNLPESTVLYLCEEFARKWENYALENMPSERGQFTLCVDDNFEGIYSSEACGGRNFHSCMTDDGQWKFYRDAVKAKAAYLKNNKGEIVSRCIIFPEVHEYGTDKIWRLAERQYAPEGYSSYPQDLMKQTLVTALIKGGYIDGYKKVGASFDAPHSFVSNNGESLSNKDFWIECNLEEGDTLSYQDSFKFYDYSNGRAYNEDGYGDDYNLSVCDREFTLPDREYDSYHDRYCSEVCTVYVCGREETCDVDDLDDFVRIDGDYYHEDDVTTCPFCGEQYVEDGGAYSYFLDECFCCSYCMEQEEADYAEDNGYVKDEINDKWIPENEAVSVIRKFFRWTTTDTTSICHAERMVERGRWYKQGEDYFVKSDLLLPSVLVL